MNDLVHGHVLEDVMCWTVQCSAVQQCSEAVPGGGGVLYLATQQADAMHSPGSSAMNRSLAVVTSVRTSPRARPDYVGYTRAHTVRSGKSSR